MGLRPVQYEQIRPGAFKRPQVRITLDAFMRLPSLVRICVLALSAVFWLPAAADGLPETIARVKPGVIGVGTVQQTRRPPVKLLATGFVVADGNHVITNAHAIPDEMASNAKEFLAVLTGDRNGTAYPAKVVTAGQSARSGALALFWPAAASFSPGEFRGCA